MLYRNGSPCYDDSSLINPDTNSSYANTNEAYLELPLRGIIIELPGLGGGSCLGGLMQRAVYSTSYAQRFGKKGILLAYLFPGPWSWGNRGAARMADGVVAAIAAKYGADVPVAVCGGSMGGLGALAYAATTAFHLCGVAAACPCIDVFSCFNAHPDYPRTFVSAVACYDMPLEDALKTISPLHLLPKMPDTPYWICSDECDEVFPEEQCNQYVASLQQMGRKVVYHRQPGLKHGDFFSGVREDLHSILEKCIEDAQK